MPGDVECRQATERDLPALAALRFRWRHGERGEEGMDEAEFAAALAGWGAEHAASHTPFVAMDGDEAVGTAWLALVERVPSPAQHTRLGGVVQSVYVVPERRNQGVGEQLMRAVISTARDRSLEWLIVHPSRRAVPFYRRLGFTGTTNMLRLDLRNLRAADGPRRKGRMPLGS